MTPSGGTALVAAVLQHEVRDDAGAVAESDQGEQGLVTIGLGGAHLSSTDL